MSCYRPLISKLWKQEQPQLRPDIRGHQSREYVMNNDSTCHADTSLREKRFMTQEYSPHSVQHGAPANQGSVPPRGVLSLGLPLGISSLKLGSRRHRRKQKKKGETALDLRDTSGHVSDGEVISGARTLHSYLSSSRQTINDEDDLIGQRPKQTNIYHKPAVTKSLSPAERKSSPGRKSQIASARYDDLYAGLRPRSVSVDAELLLHSAMTLDTRATCHKAQVQESDSELKFAGLTSPARFMMSRDKSSSGNSSGSDVTADTESDTWHHANLSPARHVSRGRARVNAVTSQAPPPRHLLPSKLRPSPRVKCHPYISLPQALTNRGNKLTTHKSEHTLLWTTLFIKPGPDFHCVHLILTLEVLVSPRHHWSLLRAVCQTLVTRVTHCALISGPASQTDLMENHSETKKTPVTSYICT